jgi:hypothetical protein
MGLRMTRYGIRLNVRYWPLDEQSDPEIQAQFGSALQRTAELSLARVIKAASDPKEN